MCRNPGIIISPYFAALHAGYMFSVPPVVHVVHVGRILRVSANPSFC